MRSNMEIRESDLGYVVGSCLFCDDSPFRRRTAF